MGKQMKVQSRREGANSGMSMVLHCVQSAHNFHKLDCTYAGTGSSH